MENNPTPPASHPQRPVRSTPLVAVNIGQAEPVPATDATPATAQAAGQDPLSRIRPLVGGIRLTGTGVGTLGLVIRSAENTLQLLTAGHVCGEVDTLVEQPGGGNVVGRVLTNGYLDGTNVDVALTSVSAGVPASAYGICGTLVDYEVTEIGDLPEQDQEVTMQGAETGVSNGTVIYPYADVTVGEEQLKGVSIANYASVPGDSGAPVMSINGDDVILLGIHGGSIIQNGIKRSWFTPVYTITDIIPLEPIGG